MNPGDLRVAEQACGLCHGEIIRHVDHSMMNHGAMLWGAALYNNGGFYQKNYRFGQAYGADGVPLAPDQLHAGHAERHQAARNPAISSIRFRASISGSPGNILRIFEKGGEKQLQLGMPDRGRAAGQAAAASFRARTRHAQSHRSRSFSDCKRRVCTIRCSVFLVRMIIRAIIARAAAPPVMSFMRTIVHRRIPAGGANTAIRV